ncbi:hypothetical protein [uncultured Salinibacterium sp.]|uniref:hypothetical protein n=1 Tax=uncultured Salinibacterium sp. TaxID=459274 RepID=UPI0030D92731
MHELSDWSGVDLLCCRYQADAALLQVGHDDRVVGTVAGETRKLVHDDEVDVTVASDAFEHLLEGNSLSHLRGRASRFHILGHDGQSELLGFALARKSLCGDRDALGVVVGVDLSLAGDAEVGDCS